MDLPVNHFKRALAEGRQQLGLWNSIPGSMIAEALATCGYDWILIDTEHAVTDVPDTLSMMQAIAAYPVSAVVRPATNDTVLIKRLLDLGAQTLLIPYVQSVDEAKAAVAATRYPPHGVRGVSSQTRASRFASVPDYRHRAEQELCLLLQIETALALDRIEDIAAVDGVDGLFIGPADLAASMGLPSHEHPAVLAAIHDAIRRINAAGKPAGILTVNPDFARQCIDWGTRFTAIGVDLNLVLSAARRLSAEFRKE